MSGNLKNWRGKDVQAQIRAEMGRRLKACAIEVTKRARQHLSVAGTGEKSAGGVVPSQGKKKKVYGAFPSQPGEPPHKQTGRLRGSVFYEVVDLAARVGTNLRYGRWLELGTSKMAARPWLRRSLAECRARIRDILKKPMNFH